MTSEEILDALRTALHRISAPRLFETERGFQGELVAQLHSLLKLNAPELVEQEYQKQQGRHGLRIRPDIIIHERFDERLHAGRDFGNLAVIELKLRASAAAAREDFESLAQMIRLLKYPLGVFVNVGALRTFENEIPADVRERIATFAVQLSEGKVEVREGTAA